MRLLIFVNEKRFSLSLFGSTRLIRTLGFFILTNFFSRGYNYRVYFLFSHEIV